MPDLDRIFTLDRTLAAAIARRERKPASHGQRDRVEGQIVRTVAWPRMVLWHAFLRQRIPTHASIRSTAGRMRGIALLRATVVARVLGQPDPVGYTPPGWARHALPPRPAEARADTPPPPPDPNAPVPKPFDYKGPFNPDPLPSNLRDKVDAAWASIDSLMADLSNDPTDGVAADAIDPTLSPQDQRAVTSGNALAQVGLDLAFPSWIEGALTDLQVLQIVNSHWNGQAASLAAQDQFTAMAGGKAAGIQGIFDMQDPYLLNFLQQNAGAYVTRIDTATRNQLAQVLWEGYGGIPGQAQGIDSLARSLYQRMQDYANARPGAGGASDISRARAQLIAVTETARAETFGQFISMLKTGARRKTWMATVGACIYCVTNVEQGDIPIFQQFPDGSLAPPRHPRCRCSLASGVTTFDPTQWDGGPSQDWFDMLASYPGIEQWPNVDLSDMEWDWSKPWQGPTPPIPTGQILDMASLPQGLADVLSPEGIQALGQRYADAVDQAAYFPEEADLTTVEDLASAPLPDDQAVLDKMRQTLGNLANLMNELRGEGG